MRIKRGPENSQNPSRRIELCGPRPARRECLQELTASITTDRPACIGAVRLFHTVGPHAQLLPDAVRGLEVSLRDVLQNLLPQRNFRH